MIYNILFIYPGLTITFREANCEREGQKGTEEV